MDLDLPDGDGLQATLEIKKLWPQVKVIILSGNSGSKPADSLVQRILLSGADAFVSKLDGEAQLGPAIKAVGAGRNFLSPEPATWLFQSLRAQAAAPLPSKPLLSQREYEVLQLLCEGRSYKDIASEFGLGVKSVETFRTRGMKKLGLTTREELLRYARHPGLPKP
jgi:DNA-binding NarL/FixJ family response regulator